MISRGVSGLTPKDPIRIHGANVKEIKVGTMEITTVMETITETTITIAITTTIAMGIMTEIEDKIETEIGIGETIIRVVLTSHLEIAKEHLDLLSLKT